MPICEEKPSIKKRREFGGETLAPVNPSMAFALFILANFVFLTICYGRIYLLSSTWAFMIG